MRLQWLSGFLAIAIICASLGCKHSGNTGSPSGNAGQVLYEVPHSDASLPVGVFDRSTVLMAFYGSPYSVDVIRKLTVQRNEAAKRGDSTRVKELEAEGARLQEMAHQQMSGKASLANLSEALKDELPKVAAEHHVREIIAAGYENKGETTVDVTSALVKLLPRSEYIGRSNR